VSLFTNTFSMLTVADSCVILLRNDLNRAINIQCAPVHHELEAAPSSRLHFRGRINLALAGHQVPGCDATYDYKSPGIPRSHAKIRPGESQAP
jgi:hypothetical protein